MTLLKLVYVCKLTSHINCYSCAKACFMTAHVISDVTFKLILINGLLGTSG